MKENRKWTPKASNVRVCCAFLACLALGSLAAPSASASPTCLPGTIATVMAQGVCTIGDKTFDFSEYGPVNYGTVSSPNGATDVLFTPLTSNPLDPGFELAAFNSTAGDYTYEYGYLYYTVSVTNGSANLIGVDESVNDPTLATAPIPAPGDGLTLAYLEAYNYLYSAGADAYQDAEQYQYTGSPANTSSYSSGAATFAPTSSGDGEAVFETYAYDYNIGTGTYGGGGTAEAAMPSVDYTFQEQSVGVTPEPGTMLLFGTGLLLAGSIVRRRLSL